MNRVLLWAASAAIALGIALPAQAQSRIVVPDDAAWKHEGSGLILRSQIAGLARGEIKDLSQAELDVAIAYDNADRSVHATLYIFRPALMSVPVWFDRAQTQIGFNDVLKGVTAQSDIERFAPTGESAASALRQVYAPNQGKIRSTGLAVIPVGEWLVTLRVTSTQLDPEQLDAKLMEVLAGVRWPSGMDAAPAAVPVAPCATALDFNKRAKMRKPDMADGLLGSMILAVGNAKADEKASDAPPAAPVLWCRDATAPTQTYGVYRNSDGAAAYTMALGDAGKTVTIQPSLMGKGEYMVWFSDLEGTSTYPSFDKLPAPEVVIPALTKSSPISRTKRGEKNITINMPSK